ncbi:class I lanthipeptide [Kordia jejudonensis]|uniref:class I lanthipeptide n=1 Tax=Kordia jejudonensis TaxID=1348245 RepID=UPI0006298C9D|nr:class I lanthipeptide [Kordia jejudonensis]
MKKSVIKNSLQIKKATIAQLHDTQVDSIKGGSTIATSVLAALCRTINPLDCSMSAFCAY